MLLRRSGHLAKTWFKATATARASVTASIHTGTAAREEDTFVIRQAKSLADLQWAMKQASDEGWRMRAKEAESYFSAGLANAFFIGELNRERICCMSAFKLGDDLATGGMYIVSKLFRGKHYGLQVFETAISEIGSPSNACFYSPMYMMDKYRDHVGYQPHWVSRRYEIPIANAKKNLSSCLLSPSIARIVPAKEVDLEDIMKYSAGVVYVGSSHVWKLMLAQWLAHHQESCWVAMGDDDSIIGYLIMSETALFPEEGYYAGPLFADSAYVARSLLKTAVDYAAETDAEIIFLDMSPKFNQEGVSIVENELGGKSIGEYMFMSRGHKIPKKPHWKAFGFASLSHI
jgi:hypothetical protein